MCRKAVVSTSDGNSNLSAIILGLGDLVAYIAGEKNCMGGNLDASAQQHKDLATGIPCKTGISPQARLNMSIKTLVTGSELLRGYCLPPHERVRFRGIDRQRVHHCRDALSKPDVHSLKLRRHFLSAWLVVFIEHPSFKGRK